MIPIPGYTIPNGIGPEEVGLHTYDSGVFAGASDGGTTSDYGAEHNGLLYTCRGGFIDTAHVRDYVDWAIYFAAQIGRRTVEGGRFVLPDEGGCRRVNVRPLPAELTDRYGLGVVVSTLAQRLSFQASIWHEIATWYGWESVPGFSERASAFSPEDLYSNMLGAHRKNSATRLCWSHCFTYAPLGRGPRRSFGRPCGARPPRCHQGDRGGPRAHHGAPSRARGVSLRHDPSWPRMRLSPRPSGAERLGDVRRVFFSCGRSWHGCAF